MYKSRQTRRKSDWSMSGDDKLDSMEVVEPEVILEPRRWMSSESGHSESHGDRNESNYDSGGSGGSRAAILDDDDNDTVQEVEIEDNDKETTLVDILPEITAKELLRLPLQQDPETIWSLVVKKFPKQRTAQEWEGMKALTFTLSNDFQPEGDEDGRKEAVEDGLFVGIPLPMTRSNIRHLKERIIRESGIGSPWFSADRNLVVSNPYRPFPLQLLQEIEQSMRRLVIFRPAEVNQLQHFHYRQLDPYTKYELTLEVGTVRFIHHPLFSKEHVLAEKLKSAFKTYATRLEENWSERCVQKLRAVRDTMRHAKEVASSNQDQPSESQLEKMLEKYRREMENLREERDESFRMDKLTLKCVLDVWKQLKKLRREQQYTCSDVQLKILSLEVDKVREKVHWEEQLHEEFRDVAESFQFNFDRQMRVYRRKMRRWTKDRRVPAEKPFEAGDGESTGSDSISATKPTPPSPFNETKARAAINKHFAEFRRLPGEPKVIIELATIPVTPISELPSTAAAEIRRRRTMESSKHQFRIWVNMKTTYSSEKKDLTPDFIIPFNVSVKLPIREVVECLHLELREDGRTLHTVELGVPNHKTSFDQSIQKATEFVASQDDIIKTGHAGVGSGVKFEILSKEYEGLPISGQLNIRIGWSTNGDGEILSPKGLDSFEEKYDEENPYRQFKDVQVETWRNYDPEMDPNDPRNAQSLGPISKHLMDGESGDEMRKELRDDEFCDWSEIQNSNRLKLLFLRDQEIPEFKNIRMVPASEADVLPDTFLEYEKRLEAEKAKESGEVWKHEREDEQVDEWDRLQPIRDMRNRLLESFETSAKQITFEDLVFEEQIPDIGTLGLNLMSLFQPRRPLRPLRKERKRIQSTLLIHTEIHLVVNIVRAINLPLRKDSHAQALSTEAITGVSLKKGGGGGGTWIHGVVKPFVEVWFQRNVSRTTTALGADPTWNQELQIPLIVEKQDFSESILSRLEEEIYLQVYDEVTIDLLEDERRRGTDIHQRLEKRWLGYIRIPFATLYRSGRIEGTFRLNCPPILLGYEGKGTEGVGEAYLTLFITLQPTISPPPVLHEMPSGTGESNEMLEHVKAWTKEIQKSGRQMRPFVLTPNGDTVLACRYLTPIEPPEEIFPEGELTLLEKMEALAHYVSLFPSLRDASLNISHYTLWFTPDVFVNTPGGGREDHSVLLASFFLHLGVKTYIIQGENIDGPTTQLLTTFNDTPSVKSALLWNPSAGTHTSVNDTLGSLNIVWTAIGPFNIWGNVGPKQRPDALDWEIEKSKDWLQLFPKGIAEAKLPRLFTGSLSFSEADEREGNRLGQRIERHLKEIFMKWRPSRTTWNRYSSTKLRSLLPLLEERRVDGSPSLVHDTHLGELREILKSYEMTGFPLHQPYSTLDSVTESVYSTGLHTIDTPEVQFALGAYARAYPASIFSLWVYIAALHPIK